MIEEGENNEKNNLYTSHHATDARSRDPDLKKQILVESKQWILQQKSVIMSWVLYFSVMMTFICTAQYGTLLIKDSFEKDDESQDYAANLLAIVFLIA